MLLETVAVVSHMQLTTVGNAAAAISLSIAWRRQSAITEAGMEPVLRQVDLQWRELLLPRGCPCRREA